MSRAHSESVFRLMKLSALACATLFTLSTAQAQSVSLNPQGTGSATPGATIASMNAQGSGFVVVQPNPADATNLSFIETGAYELTQSDGSSPLAGRDVTLTYTVVGTLNPLNYQASFTSGIVTLYSDAAYNFGSVSANSAVVFGANDGTQIASFQVTSGGGFAGGSVTVQASAISGSILPGYFSSSTGVDMATSQQMQLAISIGNTINPAPSAAIVSEIVCKAASFPGLGCAGGSYANSPYYFVVSDHAQAVLSPVPEPGQGALVLAGLVGLAVFVKRNRARNPRP